MYTEVDAISCAEDLAEAAAFADRLTYQPFIEAAERYASEKGLIVGGAGATRLLIGAREGEGPPPIGLDSFQYDFYAGGAARALGDGLADVLYAVAPEGLGHYVTIRPGPRRVISVDGRDLFTVTALPTHRGVGTAEVVIPSKRGAQFARGANEEPLPLQCMGPEIQLMGVYAALCNPGKADGWGDLLAAEASLRGIFGREIQPKIAEAVQRAGGGRVAAKGALLRALRDKYGGGPGRVLIGPVAIALLAGQEPPEGARLQFVAADPLEVEAQAIAAIAQKNGVNVQWSVNDPKIPTDSRLRRLTAYLVEGRDRREPLLDVYNAAAHELIPYVTLGAAARAVGGRRKRGRPREPSGAPRLDPDGIDRAPAAALKLGTPFVLMRFRLADLWTMQVLMRLGAASPAYAKSVMLEHVRGYHEAAALYESALARAGSDPEGAAALLLPEAAYVGRLEDPDLALKREAFASRPGQRLYPYMPALRARPGFAEKQSAAGPR